MLMTGERLVALEMQVANPHTHCMGKAHQRLCLAPSWWLWPLATTQWQQTSFPRGPLRGLAAARA